jgi:hypothetical protein
VDIDLFSRGGMAILDEIEAQGYDVLRARPTLSRWTKLRLLTRAIVAMGTAQLRSANRDTTGRDHARARPLQVSTRSSPVEDSP